MSGGTDTPKTAATKPAPRKGRWRRRLLRLAGLLVALAVILRFALPLALPSILNRVASEHDLEVSYDKLNLSVFGGSFELWHLTVRPLAPGGAGPDEGAEPLEPYAHLEFAAVDADISALLKGEFKVHRVEVDGLDVTLDRDADGTWAIERHLGGDPDAEPGELEQEAPDTAAGRSEAPLASEATPAPAETAGEDPSAEEARPFDLTLPVEIASTRLQHVRVHLRDASRELRDANGGEPLETHFELNVRVSDLGATDRPTRLEVQAHSPELLDVLRIEGTGTSAGPDLQAELAIDISGMHPLPIAPYLEAVGIRPHAQVLSFSTALAAQVEATSAEALAARAELTLADVVLASDLEEALGIDALTIDVPDLSTGGATIAAIELRGVRGRAERLSDGVLRAAGLDLIGAPAQTEPDAEEEPTEEGGSFPVEIELVRASELAFAFTDGAVVPVTRLELEVDELAARNIVLDPARPDEIIELNGTLRAPGIAEALTLEGQVLPFAPRKTFQITLAAEGLAPERLSAYLNAAGLESTLTEGNLSANIQGSVETDEAGALRAEASLTDLQLTDGDELFAVDRLALEGLFVDPAQALVRVGSVELAGTRLGVHRDSERAWHALGLRTQATPPPAAPASTSVANGTPQAPEDGPGNEPEATGDVDDAAPGADPLRIEVDRLAWTDTELRLSDDALEPALALTFDDMGFELEEFVLGGKADGPPRDPARLRLWGAANGVADELSLSGSIASQPGPLDLDLDLDLKGRGLTLEALRPYLAELGIESQLAGASLDLGIDGALRSEPEGLRANLSLTALALENAGETPLALESLHVRDLLIAEDAIRVESIDITRPALALSRDAEGGLLVAGLRLPPAAPLDPANPVDPVDPAKDRQAGDPAANAAGASAPAAGAPAADPAGSGSEPMEFSLGRFQLTEASVRWRDAAVAPAVDSALTVDGELTSLVFGTSAPTASFDLRLGLGDTLDEMAVQGTAALDPEHLRAQIDLSLDGLRAGSLASYLPEAAEVTLSDGRLRARVDAEVQSVVAGGHQARVALSDVDYRDGGAGEPLLKLDSLLLDVPRFDPAGGEVTVAELTSAGFEFSARRAGPTAFEALGFAFDTATPPGASEAGEGPDTDPALTDPAVAGAELGSDPESDPASGPPPIVGRGLRRPDGETALPTVRIDRLDFGLDRFHFIDDTHADSAPFELALRLTAPGPLTLLSDEPETLDPIELQVLGRAQPVVGDIDIHLSASPYAVDPALDLALDVSGIRGEGLTEVLPELAAKLDGSGLPDGTLTGTLTSLMRIRRRNPTDFDLSAGFGLELDLSALELRDRPGGTVLAGLESAFIDVRQIRPASGDVHVKTVEIVTPKGLAQRTPEGLLALGLLLKNPPPEAEAAGDGAAPEATESVEVAQAEPGAPEGSAPQAAAEGAAGDAAEFKLDELLITGLDFEFRDTAVSPPTVLPFNDLEVELKRFTTRALTESVPIQFRAVLGTAPIELPERLDSTLVGGLLGAATGALTGAVTGSDDEFATEERPAFGEIAASGRLVLYPELKGFTRLNVRGLELVNFRGSALEAGVDLGDGLLDTELDLRFRGEQGLSLDSKTTFAHLSVSEPAGGPISSYLKLPAPIDTVLYVLRNENEEQVIPLSVRMAPEGLSASAVSGAVVATLGTVIADAIASSPLRIVGGVLDFAGLDEEPPVELNAESLVLDFEPGDTTLRSERLAAAEPILEAMRRDDSLVLVIQHELGGGDLGQAARLSTPSEEDCLELAQRLRQRKAEYLTRRDTLAGEVRARYAVGDTTEASDTEALLEGLRDLDRELQQTEAALDAIYELLRPGAERREARRTRTAGLAVAELRLEAVRRALLDARVPKMPLRIQVRRPRFEPAEGTDGGRITLTPLRRR